MSDDREIIDLAELKNLARAATRGRWSTAELTPSRVMTPDGAISISWSHQNAGGAVDFSKAECVAAFIAAANPDAILALISRVERAEAAQLSGHPERAPCDHMGKV